jgi:eukaryotic-like serine/threonine-protein kinase
MHAPHRVALTAELERFERLIHRIWQILTAAGAVTGVIYALAVSRPLGLGCAATSAVFLIWFVLIGHLYDSGQAARPFMIANTLVEATIPWAFLLVITFTKGADYALASWVPPFLFCACITAYVPRLQPHRAALFGAAGAVLYPALYFAVLRDRLPAETIGLLVNQPATQITRSVTLLISGLIATLLIVGLRQVISIAGQGPIDPLASHGKLRQLGEQPMGPVLEASSRERRVLIEQLRPELAQRPELVGELMVRAEAAARVLHPAVLRVVDFGRGGGSYYVATELADGITLLDFENHAIGLRAPVAPEVVAELGREILAGLDAVHASGLVLGGIDRARIVLTQDGAIALGGVGLPPALRPADEGYLQPPELVRGEAPSVQTDLFSLGVVLWELLAGERRLPVHAALSLSARDASIDAGWDALFLRLLAPDAALRPASARELSELLAPYARPGARAWLAGYVRAQKRP